MEVEDKKEVLCYSCFSFFEQRTGRVLRHQALCLLPSRVFLGRFVAFVVEYELWPLRASLILVVTVQIVGIVAESLDQYWPEVSNRYRYHKCGFNCL